MTRDDTRPPVKVLVVTSIDTTLVILLWAQIRAKLVAGYEVHCACTAGRNRAFLTENGVHYHGITVRRAISPFSDLAALWKLYRLMRRERFSIVHTHTPKAALLGQLAAKLAGVPIIVNTVHGFYFHDDMKAPARWFHIAMAWIGGRCATFALSQNSEDVATALRLGISQPDRVGFLGNGVDLQRFDPDRFDHAFRSRKRRDIAVPTDCILIGMVGRLVVDKGYFELFDALASLMGCRSDFHAVIIGAYDEHRAGRFGPEEIARRGLSNCVTYLGPRGDVEECLACMDIFVLPSWREGFPRSAIEAAAMRLPIVTTNIRGCREVVRHDENGLLVPPRTPAALASAIEKLLDDGDLRDRLGRSGYERSRRDFDERIICRRVLNLYGELLDAARLDRPTAIPDRDETLPQRVAYAWESSETAGDAPARTMK